MAGFITEKQKVVLDFIKKYRSFNGYSPTLSEIQKELKIKNKRGVVQYLEALEKKNLITRSSRERGIQLVETNSKDSLFESIPIFGYANAGEPLTFAFQDRIGTIQVDRTLLPRNERVFALIISGDSMNQKKINHTKLENNNFAIISRNTEVYDGDTILAVIDECATIKTFRRYAHTIILYPESDNPVHKPIYLHENSRAFINGKVIAVLENQPTTMKDKKPINIPVLDK